MNRSQPLSRGAAVRALRLLPWAAALCVPLVVAPDTSGNLAYCLLWSFGSLGLAAMWGYGGILSFGQTAFFGLAGYSYGIFTLNYGDTWFDSWLGLGAGPVTGALCGALFALLVVSIRANQIVTGLAFTLLASSATTYLFDRNYEIGSARVDKIPQGVLIAILVILVAAVWYYLNRTTSGLALSAVGESPVAADALGYRVQRVRWFATIATGAFAGLARGPRERRQRRAHDQDGAQPGGGQIEPFPARSVLEQQRDEGRPDDRADAEEALDEVHVPRMIAGRARDLADHGQRSRLEYPDPQAGNEQQHHEYP